MNESRSWSKQNIKTTIERFKMSFFFVKKKLSNQTFDQWPLSIFYPFNHQLLPIKISCHLIILIIIIHLQLSKHFSLQISLHDDDDDDDHQLLMIKRFSHEKRKKKLSYLRNEQKAHFFFATQNLKQPNLMRFSKNKKKLQNSSSEPFNLESSSFLLHLYPPTLSLS